MKDFIKNIREIARRWLESGDVDLIIGYRSGSQPWKTQPFFARTPDDIESLVFNPFCYHNLVTYIKKAEGNIGIILRGCDGKTFVELLKENAIDRSRVKIIAVACRGMIDKVKFNRFINNDHKSIESLKFDEDTVTATVNGNTLSIGFDSLMPPNCIVCTTHISPVYDERAGDAAHFESGETGISIPQSREERWEYFKTEMSKCIRCYACRNVCPMCGCEICFVDRNQPQLLGKSVEQSDVMVYHMVRALHLAGRCVSCGACTQACPVSVDMGFLHKRLKKETKTQFDYEAGTDPDAPQPLCTFNDNDDQTFIK